MNEKEFSAPGNEISSPYEEFAQPGNEFFSSGTEQYALGSELNQNASPVPPRKRKHRVPPIFAAAAAIVVVSIATMTSHIGRVEPNYHGTSYREEFGPFLGGENGNICLVDPTVPFDYSAFLDPYAQDNLSFRLIDSSPGVEFCDLTKGNIPSWVPEDYRDGIVWLAYRLPHFDPANQNDSFFRVELNTKDVSRIAECHIVPHNQLPGVQYEPCTIQPGKPFLLTDYLHLPEKPGFMRLVHAVYLFDKNVSPEQYWEQRIELTYDDTNPTLYTLNQPLQAGSDYCISWVATWENGNPNENLTYYGYLPVTVANADFASPTPAPTAAPSSTPAPTPTATPSISATPVEQLDMDPTLYALDDSRAAVGSLQLVDRTEMFSQYDYYGGFTNGWAPVVKGDQFGYLSEQGEERMLYQIPQEELFQKLCKEWDWPIPVTPLLEERLEQYDFYEFGDEQSNGKQVALNQSYHYLNTQFACSKEGIVPYWKDGLWGYCNLDGQVLVEPQYGFVTPFGAYGAGGYAGCMSYWSGSVFEGDKNTGHSYTATVRWLNGSKEVVNEVFIPAPENQSWISNSAGAQDVGLTYETGRNVDFYDTNGQLIASEPCVEWLYPQEGYYYLGDSSDKEEYGVHPGGRPKGLVRAMDNHVVLDELYLFSTPTIFFTNNLIADSAFNRPLPGGFMYDGVVFDRNWKVHSGNYYHETTGSWKSTYDSYGGDQVPIGFTDTDSFVCRSTAEDTLSVYPSGKTGIQLAADYGQISGEDILVHTDSGHLLRVNGDGQLTDEQPLLLATLREEDKQTGLIQFRIVDQTGQEVAQLNQTGVDSCFSWNQNILQEGDWLMFQAEIGAPFQMYQVQK